MNIIPVNEHNQNGAKASSALLAIGSFEIQPTGLVIHGQPDINEWIAAGKVFKQLETAIQWVIGDWLNYGERRYGEMSAQALEATDYAYKTLRDYAWVARSIDFSQRRDNLSWSHHKEVAPLNPEDQKYYLDLAEQDQLSRRSLRDAINAPLEYMNDLSKEVVRQQKQRSRSKVRTIKIRYGLKRRSMGNCEICQFSCRLIGEVHHIVPVREGGKADLGNLIFLCPNCHAVVEKLNYKRNYWVFDRMREMYPDRGHRLLLWNVYKGVAIYNNNDKKWETPHPGPYGRVL